MAQLTRPSDQENEGFSNSLEQQDAPSQAVAAAWVRAEVAIAGGETTGEDGRADLNKVPALSAAPDASTGNAGYTGGGRGSASRSPDSPGLTGPYTHGDVLESVAATMPDMPVTPAQAAAIQSVEARALGGPGGSGGVGALAMSAADHNTNPSSSTLPEYKKPMTIGEVLQDVKSRLPRDKEVSYGDAVGVERAEARNNPTPSEKRLGVGAAELAAATINERI